MARRDDSAPRYAIITGAAAGLGQALAVRLARERYHLALADLDVDATQATAQLVEQAGGSCQIEPLDVRKLDEWESLIERLRGEWPRLDLLVNNAGVLAAGMACDLPSAEWQRVIDTNLWGVIHGCRAAHPWLREHPQGAQVLNIASIAGLVHWPGSAAYSVSKAGVVALSETLAMEWAADRIHLTLACPGFFRSQLLSHGTFSDPNIQAAAERITARATITADDVAAAALRALAKRQFYVVLPRRARVFWRIRRCFPALVRFLFQRQFLGELVDDE